MRPPFSGRMSSVAGLDLGLSKQQSGHARDVVGAHGEGKFPVDRIEEKAPGGGGAVLFSLHQQAFMNLKLSSDALRISRKQHDTVTRYAFKTSLPPPPLSLPLSGCIFFF